MNKNKLKKESEPVISLLIRDLAAGGAQKQSVLLANSLANDYSVTLMVQHKIKLNSLLYEIIDQSKVNLVFLNGSFLTRLIFLSIYVFEIDRTLASSSFLRLCALIIRIPANRSLTTSVRSENDA